MKKLLHIGCNAGTESFPKYFKEQSDYKELKLDDNLVNNLIELRNENYHPHVIFLQIQSDKIGKHDTVQYIGKLIKEFKDNGSFIINWTGDLRNQTPNWMIRFSDSVNVTAFSNYRDIEYCKSIGINSKFLQCGIDTNIFKPEGEAANVPEIVFLANNYGNQFPLSGYRKEAIRKLQSHFGNRFKVYGNGWGANSGNVNSSQYEEAKVYRGCKIAISISHYNVDGYFSDRLGRALCSGAFVLSHHYTGIERDFQVGKHLDTFMDLNDMISQCERYLSDTELREQIASEGQKLASKEFCYQNIIKQILK
jgi:glycosyltransferase involved in cell wall biosynthesis